MLTTIDSNPSTESGQREKTGSAWGVGGGLRRVVGLLLVLLGATPVFKLLDRPETGHAGNYTVGIMEIQLEFVWFGLLLVAAMIVAGAVLVPPAFDSFCNRVVTRLNGYPIGRVAAAIGVAATVLGVAFSLAVLGGNGNLIDSFVQLLQAKYLVSGQLAGPSDELNAFWAIQNSLFTERGWVSHYPPGHIVILALFIGLGVPWLSGPVLMGVAAAFTTLAADRFLPGRRATAIAGGALLAVSPFFIAVGASYMNHVTVAAFVSIGAYALARFWAGRAGWAILAGAALGAALTVRPMSTVAMAAALVLLVPHACSAGIRTMRFLYSIGLMAFGSLPFVGSLLAYNQFFFGNPFRFGYSVAMGPNMRLGFLQDPWGNSYGLREAVGYTGADLIALGVAMFESPLSAVLLIGLFLMLVPRLTPGERVLVGWALAPVVTNFFYWHHGNFMGPRMLHEVLPAWVLLFVVGAAGLMRLSTRMTTSTYRFRFGRAASFAIVLSTAVGMVFMAPQRLLSFGGNWYEFARTPLPDPGENAVVFVHDAWTSRIVMTLIGAGYRLDLIETIMRQNSTCSVAGLSDAIVQGDHDAARRALATLDTVPMAGTTLLRVDLSPGNGIKVRPGERLAGDCAVQAHSDRFGIVDISPLLWQSTPYGTTGRAPIIVRDLGPDRNQAMLDAFPGRTPWIYMLDGESVDPVLVPYSEGMSMLWR